jgi:glycosyltransferase involved in cell wall biosynthesis
MVILEALGAAVPVLATRASPWEDLVTHGCGWRTEISEEALVEALREILGAPVEVLREMGARGKALVSERCTWHAAAQKTISLYHWLLGQGEQPDFVIKD